MTSKGSLEVEEATMRRIKSAGARGVTHAGPAVPRSQSTASDAFCGGSSASNPRRPSSVTT